MSDAELVALMSEHGVRGFVFQILRHIPEQGEDLYTVLVDDSLVVEFEVTRTTKMTAVSEFSSFSLATYRYELGQGKDRIRLDQAARHARKLLCDRA
ncbi:hypothetical protein [Rhizobium sp. Leaf453]|uniref:hypothetical protein n=2 Tax=unclassified Rhizobium TaxID=2613769 RepID=UPI0012E3B867|nr:hypothetical protein [Rhizobium sp. Leaf453]